MEEQPRKSWAQASDDEKLEERLRLVRVFIEASPVKIMVGKKTLAEALAVAVVHLRELSDREIEGTLKAEESRTIPAVVSTISRMSAQLGLDTKKDDGDFTYD